MNFPDKFLGVFFCLIFFSSNWVLAKKMGYFLRFWPRFWSRAFPIFPKWHPDDYLWISQNFRQVNRPRVSLSDSDQDDADALPMLELPSTVWKNVKFTLTWNIFRENSKKWQFSSKFVDFTKFLWKNGEGQFLQIPHCVRMLEELDIIERSVS